jgi:hypothetical protein
MSAFSVAWDGALDERLRSLTEAPSDYWTTRSELPWT